MTQPHAPIEVAPERPESPADYIERRTALQEQMQAIESKLEDLDAFAFDRLRAYDAEEIHDQFRNLGHDSRARAGLVPCGVGSYVEWEIVSLSSSGVEFTHDCQAHGYDLASTETFTLPMSYLLDPAIWRAARQQEIEHEDQARIVAAEAAGRAQYDRLRRRYEDSSES